MLDYGTDEARARTRIPVLEADELKCDAINDVGARKRHKSVGGTGCERRGCFTRAQLCV